MRDNLGGAVVRLTAFVVVCLLGLFALLAVFAQLRFQKETTYNAVFTSVTGLNPGDFVRIAGVEVGKVKSMALQSDSTVKVRFSTDDSLVLTEGSRASIRYDNLIGDRYLALEEGAGSPLRLPVDGTIPTSRTSPALDLDALIGGFRPLFQALDPDQINALSSQLIQAFQGQGATISSVLGQTAVFTSTLADRDQLIGEVITNLNVVLGTLSQQGDKFGKAVDALSQLIRGLADRKVDISNSVAYTNAAAGSVADLLSAARKPLQKVVHETDRTAGIVADDRDYVDNVLATLPDDYKALSRLGLYGDYFAFYLCDLIIKVNGKGGQPVFIKLAGQSTGRCTPK
ncbi:MCE family protein [Mycobacterium sp. GA-2829]|uniref:MCE family protein n=1 Tax=Mycobacterium sp. GA-2829 TaxID=1772283 RepID=UPI0007404035|nr:MCE family protein [Mycobacterium sp. GA-2829]KUI29338.1 mammalian cell entry protein [Mycobacterium sp. GA-2829]